MRNLNVFIPPSGENSDTDRERINRNIAEIRGRTLDAVESQIGNVPKWQVVRRQLLRLFGDLERLVGEFSSGGSEQ